MTLAMEGESPTTIGGHLCPVALALALCSASALENLLQLLKSTSYQPQGDMSLIRDPLLKINFRSADWRGKCQ